MNKKSAHIKTIALFNYQTPIDQLVLGIKFSNNLVNAKVLGDLLANHLANYYEQQQKPEIIIPVPLHPNRLRERGYNQALELAKPIAKKLEIPVDKYNVERTKNTLAQARLPSRLRKKNISKAFSLAKPIHHKHVAIIDDVITTGNTVNELCKILHREGINKIDVWCLARAS